MKKIILGLIVGFVFILKIGAADCPVKIGSTDYDDFNTAVSSATSGAEVKLTTNCVNYPDKTIPAGKNIVLNTNGYNITNIKNNGDLRIIGSGKVLCESYNGIENNGKLIIDDENLQFSVNTSTNKLIINNGELIINDGKFVKVDGYPTFIINNSEAKTIINGGSFNGHVLFKNNGEFIIEDGTFITDSNSESNLNTNALTVNGGTFKSPNTNFFTNTRGIININDGNFECKSIAENYDASYLSNSGIESIINVDGGKFVTTDTAFSNVSLSNYSTINFNNGIIQSETSSYILSNLNTTPNNFINITGGTIDAKNSTGLFLTGDSNFTIGTDDGKVSSTSPLIYINNGKIEGLDTPNLNFYDGKIILSKIISLDTVVPDAYYIKYDQNDADSLVAYLYRDGDELPSATVSGTKDNKSTSDNPSTFIDSKYLLFILLIVFSSVSYLIIRKKTNFIRH